MMLSAPARQLLPESSCAFRARFPSNHHHGAATCADGPARRFCARAPCADDAEPTRDHIPRARGADLALPPRREVVSRNHRRQLHVHYGTVARVLAQAGLPRIGRARASAIDAYLPFILQTLEKFPTLTASRLYAMVRERGYAGGPA